MTDSNNIDHHFLTEAPDLLQDIETTLITLRFRKYPKRDRGAKSSALIFLFVSTKNN